MFGDLHDERVSPGEIGVEQDNTQCSTICVNMYTLSLENT